MGVILTPSAVIRGFQNGKKFYIMKFCSQSTRKIHWHRTESSMRIILSSRSESRLSQRRSILTLRRDKQAGNGDIR